MPIDPTSLQPRPRELGRIRLGQRVERTGKGGRKVTVPTKLDTFRLTSRYRELIEEAAVMFGGEVADWRSPTGDEFEVVTERDWMNVLIPPPFDINASQSWELWSADGPLRRCTGRFTYDGEACLCPSDPAEKMELAAKGEACRPVTRLRVMIPGIPDVGVWRLETGSYNAAMELAASMAVFAWLDTNRAMPAVLRLEQRQKKIAGQADRHFAVPILEVRAALERMLDAAGRADMLDPIPPERPTKQLKAADLDVDPDPSDALPGRIPDESASETSPFGAGDDEGGGDALLGHPEDELPPPSIDDIITVAAVIVDAGSDEEPPSDSSPLASDDSDTPLPATTDELWRLAGLVYPEKDEDAVVKLFGVAPDKMSDSQLENYTGMLRRKAERKGIATR